MCALDDFNTFKSLFELGSYNFIRIYKQLFFSTIVNIFEKHHSNIVWQAVNERRTF